MSYACVVNLWLVCVLINFSGSLCNSIIDDPVQSLQDHLSKYYSFLQMFFGHNLMFLITCSYPKTKLDKLFKNILTYNVSCQSIGYISILYFYIYEISMIYLKLTKF